VGNYMRGHLQVVLAGTLAVGLAREVEAQGVVDGLGDICVVSVPSAVAGHCAAFASAQVGS